MHIKINEFISHYWNAEFHSYLYTTTTTTTTTTTLATTTITTTTTTNTRSSTADAVDGGVKKARGGVSRPASPVGAAESCKGHGMEGREGGGSAENEGGTG